MTIKSQHYLFTLHPIKLHIFLKKLYNKFFNFGYTHHCYLDILEANHFMNKHGTLPIKLYVCLTFCSIHKILLSVINKIKKMTDNIMILASHDFHYMFVNI